MRKNTQKIIFNILVVILFIWSNAYSSVTPSTHKENTYIEWHALNNTVSTLYEKGQYESAIMQAKKALALIQSVKGSHSLDATKNMDQLGLLYKSQAKYQESEAFYLQSLAIKETALGTADLKVAEALDNLAVMYQHKVIHTLHEFEGWDLEKKINQLLIRALTIREKKLGHNHIDLVQNLNNLARRSRLLGADEMAIDLYRRALNIVEKTRGVDHLEVAIALKNLAVAAESRDKFIQDTVTLATRDPYVGRYKTFKPAPKFKDTYNTVSLYERALAIQEKWLGLNHIDLVDTLLHLGKRWDDVEYDAESLLKKDEFIKRAESIKIQAFKAYYPDIRMGGIMPEMYLDSYSMMTTNEIEPAYQALNPWEKSSKNQPSLAGAILSLNDSGEAMLEIAQFQFAELFYKRAFDLGATIFEGNDSSLSSTQNFNAVANLYLLQGKYEQAELRLERALKDQEKKMLAVQIESGQDTSESTMALITILKRYALFYVLQGKYEQALPFYERAIAEFENKAISLSESQHHFDFVALLTGIADIYYNQGHYQQALPFYERAFLLAEEASKTSKRTDPPVIIARTLNNLAGVNRALKNYDKAESLYLEVLIRWQSIQYNEKTKQYASNLMNEPERSYTLYSLAELYREQEKYALAKATYHQALEIRERIFGAYHPDVAQSLSGLAAFYNDQNQAETAKQFETRAASIMAHNFNSDNIDLARRLAEIKVFYYSQGSNHKVAFSQIIAAREQLIDKEDFNFAISLMHLGTAHFYSNIGDYFDRYSLWKRALTILEQNEKSGQEHEKIQLTMAFVLDYLILGKEKWEVSSSKPRIRWKRIPEVADDAEFDEAVVSYERALAIKTRILGKNHLSLATTYDNMARMCAKARYETGGVHWVEHSFKELQTIKSRDKKRLWLEERAAEIRVGK